MILAYIVIAVLTGLSLWFSVKALRGLKAGRFTDLVLNAAVCTYLFSLDLMFCLGVVLS